jgi:beta-glucosidase
VTIPRHAGQLPVHYDQPRSKPYWLKHGWGVPYADLEPTPLFPFGHGLSYTRFAYVDLRLGAREIGPADGLEVLVDVKNVGSRAGSETVQLYLHDVVSSVATPEMRLRGFEKLRLAPGETATARFDLGPADLALLDTRLRRVVEPGEFEVRVGASAADIRLTGRFVVR